MQHFVTVLGGYMSYQVLEVSWSELQQELASFRSSKSVGLDGLLQMHEKYVENLTFRSMLSPNAKPVKKIIDGVLELILKFRAQITQAQAVWRSPVSFRLLEQTHAKFLEYVRFLRSVTAKLVEKGYQPYLELLLNLMDYNEFYAGTEE